MLKVVVASLLLSFPFCALASTSVDVSKIYGKIQVVDSYSGFTIQ